MLMRGFVNGAEVGCEVKSQNSKFKSLKYEVKGFNRKERKGLSSVRVLNLMHKDAKDVRIVLASSLRLLCELCGFCIIIRKMHSRLVSRVTNSEMFSLFRNL